MKLIYPDKFTITTCENISSSGTDSNADYLRVFTINSAYEIKYEDMEDYICFEIYPGNNEKSLWDSNISSYHAHWKK